VGEGPLVTSFRPTKAAFTGGVLSPALFGRLDLSKYDIGAKQLHNTIVHAEGGASNRPGTEYVIRANGLLRLIPFAFSVQQTYVLEFGDQYMRVIKDGAVVTEASQAITGITQADPAVVSIVGHGYSDGDWIYIGGVVGMTEVNGSFYRVASASTDAFALQDLDGNDVDSTGWGAYASDGEAERVYQIATPYAAAQLREIKFTQSADVMYLAHPSHAPRSLSRTGHTSWTLAALTFGPSLASPTGLGVSGGTAGSGTQYQITAVADETLEESLPASTSSGNVPTSGSPITLSWSAVAGAGKYNVYKKGAGLYGFIGSTDGTSFADDNIAPDETDTPPGSRTVFDGAGAYPGAVGLHEQRLGFGATDNDPQKSWLSNSAEYLNFNVSTPSKDSDAVTFTIAARQVNKIEHYVSLSDLLILTSGAVWKVNGGDEIAVTPSNVNVKPQSYRGCSPLPPLLVDDSVLYVVRGQRQVRDLQYRLEIDGYSGNELSVLARHLFDRSSGSRIEEWALAERPYGIVWCVLADGTMAGLTYLKEHDVWAWHTHSTDGEVVSVASVVEGEADDVDAVYLAVKRTIGGQDRYYIERMKERDFSTVEDCFFVDCGLTYNGADATEISGLDHLEGKTVAILADGGVRPQQVVTGGRITLSPAAGKVHIGLPYEAVIETMPIQFAEGQVAGRKKRASNLLARVINTREFRAGSSTESTLETKLRADEAWGEPTRLLSDEIKIYIDPAWERDTTIVIVQDNPLPLTVLSLRPDLELGD
jgi:hypothetical protein